MRIAVLGTGAMGSRLARRLLEAEEHEITVWNRTANRLDTLAHAGARIAATPADAARGRDVVLTMLRDDEAGRAVWLDPHHGALPAMTTGTVAVDCSTVTPEWAGELAARCAKREVHALDAPVVGSRPQADAGALIVLVGGDSAVLERVAPVLRTFGAAVHHAGPAGAGARMKLLINALFAVQVAAVAELLAALTEAHVEHGRMVEILAATPVASPAAAAAATAMLRRSFTPAFPIDLVVKDLRYATARHPAVPVTRATAAVFEQAAERGYAGDNITGVAQLYPTLTAPAQTGVPQPGESLAL